MTNPFRSRNSWAALLLAGLATATLLCAARPGFGQEEGAGGLPALPATSESSDQPAAQDGQPSIRSSLGPGADPIGLRGTLEANGVSYSLTGIAEVLGNATGGIRRGAIGEGRLDAQLDIDLGRLAGLDGLALHANAYGIGGHGLSRYQLANFHTASGIEALSSGRLFELWLEQKLLDGAAFLRVGQLAADTEFVVTQYGGVFVNATFGFPSILAADLPNGGPAYPLATPGARLKLQPDPNLSIILGVFDGASAGRGPGDPQANNRNGTEFRLRDPALLMGEIAWSYGSSQGNGPLPGTVKLGAFGHLGRFDDLRPGPDGSPSGRLRGDAGLYGVIDQSLYRERQDADQGLAAFLRAAAAPGDRNLVDLYVDGGFTYKGLLPGRRDDTVGLGAAYTRISAAARSADRLAALADPGTPAARRSSEALLELTYQALIVPGWTLQPDLQYVIRPGAGALDPRTGRPPRNAFVAGLRTAIRY